MTREELERIYILKKELKMWQDRKEELILDIAPPGQQFSGMPFANTNEIHSQTEAKAERLLECASAIDEKIAELQKAIRKAERYILTLEDSQMRMILELRCVGCWSWKRISGYMGDGYTADMVRQTYHRFMRRLK